MTIRVVLADDDRLLRAGLALVLGTATDLQVVAEAGDGIQAVEQTLANSPDVVLMDVRMPGIDGIQATRRLVAARPDIKILILTTFPDDEYVYGALRAGASGFLLKRASPERLLDAVRTVAAGEALLDPSVTRNLIHRYLATGEGRLLSQPPRLDSGSIGSRTANGRCCSSSRRAARTQRSPSCW